MTATSGSSDSINTYFIQKALACHPNFWKCTLTVEYIAVLRVATLIFGENKMAGRPTISTKTNGFKLIIYAKTALTRKIYQTSNKHQILINIIIFVAYVLNLPLNTQRSHSRSQRAGKWSLILAHDRRPIYRAPTYIAVPLLGPHQPRYIGLTLYLNLASTVPAGDLAHQNLVPGFVWPPMIWNSNMDISQHVSGVLPGLIL